MPGKILGIQLIRHLGIETLEEAWVIGDEPVLLSCYVCGEDDPDVLRCFDLCPTKACHAITYCMRHIGQCRWTCDCRM